MESGEYIEYTEPIDYTEPVDTYVEDLPVNQLRFSSKSDYVWSLVVSLITISVFVIQQPGKMMHWMLLPLALCGTLVGADAIRWLKGTYTIFDPKGTIGLLGVNFFLVAPLLIVFHDVEGVETYVVSQWQPLLGIMALFNAVGLIVYKLAEKFAFRRPSKVERTYWTLNSSRASFFVPLFVILAFFSLCFYMFRGGGLAGILLQERQSEANVGLVGMGPFMILRDALPLSVLIGLTVYRISNAQTGKSPWWFFLGVGMLVLFFFTSGLRGSRAATAYGLICAGAMIHFFWRKLTVKIILMTLIPLGMFFYLYGFYKSTGIVGIKQLVQGQTTIRHLQEQSKRTAVSYFIGDLSRAHVQAAEADVLVNKPYPYRYRYGKTYPLAFGYLIPRRIWRSKPIDMGRIIAGTEMLYGEGTYGAFVKVGGGGNRSTQLYGLAGEAMLNFGLVGIPAVFAVWGYVVGRIRKRLYSYRPGDLRLLMTGFWMLFGFMMLLADMDILVWFCISLYIIPATLIYLITDKIHLNEYYE